jgi:hypothetical protein
MMADLLSYCVKFIAQNLNEVIEKGESVHLYKSSIAKKISKVVDLDILDKVFDPDDVIFSRLYKKKLEIFFEDTSNLLYLCKHCH